MRILVVEDDAEAATAMVRGLTEAGHEPTHAVDGAFGLLEAQKGGYDVYVVDRMMPRLDGIGMVETLRKDGDQTPVLFLSALGEVEDRVTGLNAGADDYLVKPYAFSELIARVEALSRRRESGSVATMLKVGDLEMNLIARTVHRTGQEIDLQPREFPSAACAPRSTRASTTPCCRRCAGRGTGWSRKAKIFSLPLRGRVVAERPGGEGSATWAR
jgi:two-component system OmpR family response regulator